MTEYLKYDQRKPLTLFEIQNIFDKAELEHQRKKQKSRVKKHRHSKQRKNK